MKQGRKAKGSHGEIAILPLKKGKSMKKAFLFLCVGIVTLFLSSVVYATPIGVGGPIDGPGDGLNARWIDTNWAPQNADNALSALSLGSGDAGYVAEVNQVVSAIDFADSNLQGSVAGYTIDPLSPDNSFAVGYTGYINIATADLYSFNAYTDDGFSLVIGGQMISQHYGNRAPGHTYDSIDLAAGLYEFMMVGWERGGVFVNELSWHDSSTTSWSLVDSDVLFTSNPVPEPATMILFGIGLLGLAGVARRRQ